jgi:hypothetical protein
MLEVEGMRVIRTFSMPEIKSYNKFKELCEREGSNVSSKLYEYIKQYVADHSPGNPQRHLGVYLNPAPRDVVCPMWNRDMLSCGQHTFVDVCPLSKRYKCPRPSTTTETIYEGEDVELLPDRYLKDGGR